jgi:hypothetical protein
VYSRVHGARGAKIASEVNFLPPRPTFERAAGPNRAERVAVAADSGNCFEPRSPPSPRLHVIRVHFADLPPQREAASRAVATRGASQIWEGNPTASLAPDELVSIRVALPQYFVPTQSAQHLADHLSRLSPGGIDDSGRTPRTSPRAGACLRRDTAPQRASTLPATTATPPTAPFYASPST